MSSQHAAGGAGLDQGAAARSDLPMGEFVYSPGSARMTFSPSLYDMFGFSIGEIVPTLELLAAHQHPDHRAGWVRAVEHTLATGQRVGLWHRLVDANARQRSLYTVLTADTDDDDGAAQVTTITGVISDLSEPVQLERAEEARRAVAQAAQSRTVIDEAKGILMAVLSLSDAQAFDLLRWHSSHRNVKLRDIAAEVVDHIPVVHSDASWAAAPRQQLTAVLADTRVRPRTPRPVPPHGVQALPPAADAAQRADSTLRIPAAVLPDTMILAVEAAASSITIADCLAPDQPLVYVNTAFQAMTGYTAKEVLGRNCRFLQGPDTDRQQTAAVRAAIDAGDTVQTVVLNHRKDGTAFWNELLLAPVRAAGGQITHYVGYQNDVSERLERDLQLQRLAYQDPATGLPNHVAAQNHLQALIESTPGDREITVYNIALSNLRLTAGPGELVDASAVMATAAQRLREALTDTEYLAKADGNAFLIVSADNTQIAAVTLLEHAYPTSSGDVSVTVRTGSARYPEDAVDPATLIALAAGRAYRSAAH